jgi:L-asparaginase
MSAARRAKVAIIGTGGSISQVGQDSLDLVEYSSAGRIMEVDELLNRFPAIAGAAEVLPVRFRAISSDAVTPEDWLELASMVHHVVESQPDVHGIVITHGTATLEETAYFLNLTLKVDRPVVVVGSQRPPTALSSDAGLNLVNAIRVAADPASAGRGVLVVLNDEIQSAREVTKASNYRLEAFRCQDLGMLGYADADGKVVFYRASTRRHSPNTEFDVGVLRKLPRVDITYSYAFADGIAIRALVAAGARGIVSASLAPGLVTPGEWDAIGEARQRGVVVVQSSRAGSGRVLGGQPHRELGLVIADNLNPQKARVLTMLALTVTDDPRRIQEMFNDY